MKQQQSRKKAAKAKKKEDKKNAPPAAAPAAAAAPSPLKKLQPPPPEWKPTMDSLRCLPCIQHLGLVVAGSNSAAAAYASKSESSSMIGKIPTAVLEHLLEERSVQSIVRKILADEKDKKPKKDSTSSTYTFATSATIRDLKERAESQTVATTRAISKHYRRASVQVRREIERERAFFGLLRCVACCLY